MLNMIDAVKQKHKEWVATTPQTTLGELIDLNHAYILSIIEKEKKKFQSNGVPLFKLRTEYPLSFIHFGANVIDTNNENK